MNVASSEERADETTSTKGPARELLSSMAQELRSLLAERATLARRIETVRRSISALAAMFGDDVLTDELLILLGRKRTHHVTGLTVACRTVLQESEGSVGAREVRDRILSINAAILQHHKSSLASITTVLNRLVSYGEARVVNRQGQRAWESTGANNGQRNP